MIETLIKAGYKHIDIDTYQKGDWTIRWDDTLLEVYSEIGIGVGYYYSKDVKKVDLDLILSEIEEFQYRD